MSEQLPQPPLSRVRRHTLWAMALVATGATVASGVYVVSRHFDWAYPHVWWSRTIAGLLLVPVAILGTLIPLLLILKRSRFIGLQRSRQWIALGVILLMCPGAYLLTLAALTSFAQNSMPVLPDTPNVVVSYDQAAASVYCRVSGGIGHGGGHRHGNGEEGGDWECWIEPARARGATGPLEPDFRLKWETVRAPDGRLEISLAVTGNRKARLHVQDFEEVRITRDGATIAEPVELAPGTHQFEISGRPR